MATEIKELHDCESDNEDVFSSDLLENEISEMPKAPPLPVKTRPKSFKSERHKSQYDNVEEMENDRKLVFFAFSQNYVCILNLYSTISAQLILSCEPPRRHHLRHHL